MISGKAYNKLLHSEILLASLPKFRRMGRSLQYEGSVKFKYVNPKLVEEVIGRYAPVGSFVLARIIEESLENTNLGYVHTEAEKEASKATRLKYQRH